MIPFAISGITSPDQSRLHARDGSATAGTDLSMPLAQPRIAPRLAAYTPSRSDRSGTPKAGTGKLRIDRFEAPLRGAIAAEKEAFHFLPQLRHGGIQRFPPRIDDDGPLGIQPIESAADGFAKPPFDSIAGHRLAKGAGHRESDPRAVHFRVANTERGKTGGRKSGPPIVHRSEILRSQQADTFRKTSDGLVPFGADRELLPPTGPAPGQNRTAILGLHAGAETVRFGAPAIIRLKRTFRHSCSNT